MKALIILVDLIVFGMIVWGLFLLSPFSAEAENIPTSPKGCFVLEGETECYTKDVDCGNGVEDFPLKPYYTLAPLYGDTVAYLCNDLLVAEAEVDEQFFEGVAVGEAWCKQDKRKLRRKLRRYKKRWEENC